MLFTGCGQSVPDRAALNDDGAIQKLSFSRAGTGAEYEFDYCIFQIGEAYYFTNAAENEGGIGTASVEVGEDDLRQARELCAQYGIKSYLEAYKPPLLNLLPQQNEKYTTLIELDDGTVLSAESDGSWGDALKVFFGELELKYAGEQAK